MTARQYVAHEITDGIAHVRLTRPDKLNALTLQTLDELKLQPNGGRGLTLMDVDAKDPLVSVAVFDERLQVRGLGRGDKPRQLELRGAALAHHVGRRARKGRKVEGLKSGQRVLA